MWIDPPPPSADSERIAAASARDMGYAMNLTQAWGWRPDVYDAFAALRQRLTSTSALTPRDLAVLVCATAAELGDAYCALAWGHTLTQRAGAGVAAAVLSGADDAAAETTERDRALAAWARQVVADPNATTPDGVERLRRAGLGDAEVFEATVFVAFRLAFSTVNDALGVAPDPALVERLAPEVAAAVTYGRRPAG